MCAFSSPMGRRIKHEKTHRRRCVPLLPRVGFLTENLFLHCACTRAFQFGFRFVDCLPVYLSPTKRKRNRDSGKYNARNRSRLSYFARTLHLPGEEASNSEMEKNNAEEMSILPANTAAIYSGNGSDNCFPCLLFFHLAEFPVCEAEGA